MYKMHSYDIAQKDDSFSHTSCVLTPPQRHESERHAATIPSLQGSFRVVFASHQEEHICTAMPTVRLLPVTGSASRCSVRLVFQGEIALVCPARGLSLTAILAEDGTCRGTVTRMLGDADVSVASIKGSLQAGIFAASDKGVLPITGPLGDGSPVDLADIG